MEPLRLINPESPPRRSDALSVSVAYVSDAEHLINHARYTQHHRQIGDTTLNTNLTMLSSPPRMPDLSRRSNSPGKRQGKKTLAAVIGAAAILGGVLVPTVASADPGGCEDLFVLGARGSGEAQDDRGGLGSTTIGPFVDSLRAALPATVSFRAGGLAYPATAIPALIGGGADATQNYDASITEGGTYAARVLDAQVAACPNQRFILAGYSQGADAIGNLLERRPDFYPRIAWVALFGDPRFDSGTTSSVGALRGTAGEGRGISGIARLVPPPLVGRFTSACLDADIVCLGAIPGNNVATHLEYVSSGTTVRIADEAAQKVLAAPPPPPPPARVPGLQGDRLLPGQYLLRGDYLQSANGECRLALKVDGMLELKSFSDTYRGAILWFPTVSGSNGFKVPPEATSATMQTDGSFVLEAGRLEEAPTLVWYDDQRKGQVAGTVAVLQDDCNFVGYAPDGRVMFSSFDRPAFPVIH